MMNIVFTIVNNRICEQLYAYTIYETYPTINKGVSRNLKKRSSALTASIPYDRSNFIHLISRVLYIPTIDIIKTLVLKLHSILIASLS